MLLKVPIATFSILESVSCHHIGIIKFCLLTLGDFPTNKDAEDALNAKAGQGWELISVVATDTVKQMPPPSTSAEIREQEELRKAGPWPSR
jgi:hypothetical protein